MLSFIKNAGVNRFYFLTIKRLSSNFIDCCYLNLIAMKNVLRILVLLLLTASLSSCEKFKSMFDKEVNTTITGDLLILSENTNVKSTEDYEFHETITVPVLNDDLYEYEDKIQSFRSSDLTIEVISIDSADVVVRAGSVFAIYNDEHSFKYKLPTDWPIEQGNYMVLEGDALLTVDSILDDRIDFTMSADGKVNKGWVTFELRYGVEVKVVANPF